MPYVTCWNVDLGVSINRKSQLHGVLRYAILPVTMSINADAAADRMIWYVVDVFFNAASSCSSTLYIPRQVLHIYTYYCLCRNPNDDDLRDGSHVTLLTPRTSLITVITTAVYRVHIMYRTYTYGGQVYRAFIYRHLFDVLTARRVCYTSLVLA